VTTDLTGLVTRIRECYSLTPIDDFITLSALSISTHHV